MASALLCASALCATSSCARASELVWSSGFENGFPGGEWHPWDSGSWSADGSLPSGRQSAWTIVHRDSGEPVFSGDHAYRGWIEAPASSSHRAYPGISADDPSNIEDPIPTPLVNSFMVYLDADFDALGSGEWIHLGTWGNNVDWVVHTMSVRGGMLELAHMSPFLGEYIGPLPREPFPLRRWVRITVYIEYNGATGYVHVWQDGVPIFRGDYTNHPGTHLLRAHWGMYASAGVGAGVQYNDDIRIWSLDQPLAAFDDEPLPVPEPSADCLRLVGLFSLAGPAWYARQLRSPGGGSGAPGRR